LHASRLCIGAHYWTSPLPPDLRDWL
jgi:hypothetical protein